MALIARRKFADCLLDLKKAEGVEQVTNHILEPEFHQDLYRGACEEAARTAHSFQLGDLEFLERAPNRGVQPSYVDDENDSESLEYIGMPDKLGGYLTATNTTNICALKSISVRQGYVDFGVARAVSAEFYKKKFDRASVKKNDVLINSTGDGTIGRVAVYNADHPALVDGHITIVRFKNNELAWYVAAYLISQQGQRQIYRYINGSSGQVEIYPQDIERLWIPGATAHSIKSVADRYKKAVGKYEAFQQGMTETMSVFL